MGLYVAVVVKNALFSSFVLGTYTSLEVGDGFLDRLLSYKQERSTTLPDSLSEGNLLAQILQRKRRNSSVNQRPKGRLNGLFPRGKSNFLLTAVTVILQV